MAEKEEERNLETTTSSMDVASLNNLIVSMRGVVKRCRVQVVNKLTGMIKKYRNKKGSEAEMLANQRKAERLLQEIEILKGVQNDKIAKFALANTLTVEDAARQGGSVQTKVLTRMACHKPIQTKVVQWRKEHDDWSSLAAFILTKNTGRRFKKKKKKPQKGKSANPKELAEAETIESYRVTGKLDKVVLSQGPKTTKAVSQGHNTTKAVERSDESSSDSEERTEGAVKICAKVHDYVVDHEADGRLGATSSSDKEDTCLDGSVSASEDDEASENEAASEDEEASEDGAESDSATLQSDSPTLQRKHESVTKTNRTSKEMVIRKLDLSSLQNEDLIDSAQTESGPGFLFAPKDIKQENKTERAKDPFFVASSDEEAEDEAEEEEEGEGNEEEEENRDSDAENESGYVGRPNMDSMFLGNLSSQHSKRGSHRGRPMNRGGWGEKRGSGRGMRGFPRTRGFSREGQRKDFRGRGGCFDQGSRGRPAGQLFGARRTDGPRQQQVTKSVTNKPPEEEKLHPSWEASKKRKEQHNTIQPFQGKKIKFGEDS